MVQIFQQRGQGGAVYVCKVYVFPPWISTLVTRVRTPNPEKKWHLVPRGLHLHARESGPWTYSCI